MKSSENNKIRINQININSNRNKKIESNRFYDRISAMNSPLSQKLLTEINIEKNKKMKTDKNLGSFVYKSILDPLENNQNKNGNNYINDNNVNFQKENDKQQSYILSTSSNKKNNKKYNVNLKKKFQNIKNNNNDITNNNNNRYYKKDSNKMNIINNIYNDNEEEDIMNNYYNGVLTNDIKYQKQYSFNQTNNNKNNNKKEYSQKHSFLSGRKDYNENTYNSNVENISQNAKSMKYQKSEDNLNQNIFLDKEEFMKKIKEIDDLELLDLNDDYGNIKFSDNVSNINSNIYESKNQRNNVKNISENNSRNQIYNNNNNSVINNNKNYKQQTFKNVNNIINLSNNLKKRNMSIGRQNIYISNALDKNNDEKNMQLTDLTTTNSNNFTRINVYGLDLNSNSFHKNKNKINKRMNNYILSTDNNDLNYFSTLSNGEIEMNMPKKRIINLNNNYSNKNNNKKNMDYSIQTQIKKYKDIINNVENINDDAFLSIRSNNYMISPNNKYNNISNFSDNNNIYEIKEENEKLKNELKLKNNEIDKYSKVIKEYKKKILQLIEKNKKLEEDSKKSQSSLLQQIKEYQNEIYTLKKNNYEIFKNSVKSSKSENLKNNYFNKDEYNKKINELKEEIENYKVENNKLKMLVIKYKNSANKSNSGNHSQIDDNSKNNFYSSKSPYKKFDKKSYSVSKSKKKARMSIFSRKNFEEDNYIVSDNENHENYNHVKSFMLY